MDSNLNNTKLKCAELLQKMLDGEITPQQAKQGWPSNKFKDRDLDVIFHQLGHYIDDNDIRAKDARYEKWQKSEIKELIELLKS